MGPGRLPRRARAAQEGRDALSELVQAQADTTGFGVLQEAPGATADRGECPARGQCRGRLAQADPDRSRLGGFRERYPEPTSR
ncbi:hypothetical protein GCM10018966_068320 [Streptomyces yanii]